MVDEQETGRASWGQEPGRTVHWLERVLPGLVIGLIVAIVVVGLLYLAIGD